VASHRALTPCPGHAHHHPLGALIGIGFLGIFVASVRWFLSTFPAVQIWQPPFEAERLEAELMLDEEGEVVVATPERGRREESRGL
jgi:hypothetical protein